MESLKAMINNMSDMSKLLLKLILGIIGALIILFLIVLIFRVIKGGSHDFNSVERTMQQAAIRYYKKNNEELPKIGEEIVISADTLVSQKYMKELNKYLKNQTCTGNVTVLNNNDNYIYLPYLDCQKEYTTKILSDSILENNKLVTTESGLYLDNQDYIFKGEYVNNYLTFAGMTWRILRVKDDGSIRLILSTPIKNHNTSIWDNRYNVDKKNSAGINNFEKSRIREKLASIYNDEKIFNENQKALIESQNLCIGARGVDSTDFTSSEECSKVLENQYIGLIQVNEFLQISIDSNCLKTNSPSCSNYNYLADLGEVHWTITPSNEDTYHAFRIAKSVYTAQTSGSTHILPVINLSNKTQISGGDGSQNDPYIVKDYTTKK